MRGAFNPGSCPCFFVSTVMPCPWDSDRFYTIVGPYGVVAFKTARPLSWEERLRTVAEKGSICCRPVWIQPFIIWLPRLTEPWMKRCLRWHFAAHLKKPYVLQSRSWNLAFSPHSDFFFVSEADFKKYQTLNLKYLGAKTIHGLLNSSNSLPRLINNHIIGGKNSAAVQSLWLYSSKTRRCHNTFSFWRTSGSEWLL